MLGLVSGSSSPVVHREADRNRTKEQPWAPPAKLTLGRTGQDGPAPCAPSPGATAGRRQRPAQTPAPARQENAADTDRFVFGSNRPASARPMTRNVGPGCNEPKRFHRAGAGAQSLGSGGAEAGRGRQCTLTAPRARPPPAPRARVRPSPKSPLPTEPRARRGARDSPSAPGHRRRCQPSAPPPFQAPGPSPHQG